MSRTSESDVARDRLGLWGILVPAILWAVHFVALYAIDAAACGPRALIAVDTARVASILMAAVSLLALMAGAWATTRRGTGGALGTATVWTAIISAIAIVVQTIPAVQFTACG